MKVGIVVGSHRKQSQSAKVGRYLAQVINDAIPDARLFTLDLGISPLPMWDEGVWDSTPEWNRVWGPISESLKACDAFFFISPEYAGMASAALKNFFMLASGGGKELAHKPAVLVGVSSARGGAYPISELRASGYKNSYVNFIPDHLIVRQVEGILNGPESTSEDETYMRGRIEYTVRVLAAYAKAFQQIRQAGVIDLKTYANGM